MKIKTLLLALLFSAILPPLYAQKQNNAELSALLGGMVQSDKWIIRKDKAEEEFIGNVRYENEIYKLSADKALSQRSINAYTLSGNVSASKKENGQTLNLQASKIFFNAKKKIGYAQGSKKKQVQAYLDNGSNLFNLYADKINFTDNFTFFEAEGDCELSDLDNTLYSGKMTYNAKNKVFSATERRPIVFGYNADGDYALQAEEISVDNEKGVYRAAGGVRGWIVPAEDLTKYTQGQKDGTKVF